MHAEPLTDVDSEASSPGSDSTGQLVVAGTSADSLRTGSRAPHLALVPPPSDDFATNPAHQADAPATRHEDEEANVEVFPTAELVQWRLKTLPRSRFVVLQSWEGYVLEVNKDSFVARLIDQSGRDDDEEAEIYLEEVDPGDRGLVAPGAYFYWSIGYRDGRRGRERVSVIRFRRLPAFTEQDRTRARAEARRAGRLLGWD